MSGSRFWRRLVVIAVAALAGAAPGSAEADTKFDSPSRNLGCSYFGPANGDYVVCGRRHDGRGAILRGRPPRALRYDSGPPPLNRRVLGYGKSLHLGRFICVSRTTGIACRAGNRAGFRISREAIVIFRPRR